MRTEIEIKADIRKAYNELNKIRQTVYAEYVGKCYEINGIFCFVKDVLDKGFSILQVDENDVRLTVMEIPIEQWTDWEIPKEKFIQELEKRVDLIIKQVKGEK